MKSKKKYTILFLFSLFCWVSCQPTHEEKQQLEEEKSNESANSHQEQPELIAASENIKKQLTAYYSDLAREEINVADYYAPEVRTFFKQKGLSRDQIQKSLENGFQRVENRSLSLDENSLQITQDGDLYQARFSGNVSYTRSSDKSIVEESFSNQVTFNSNFEILSYESIDASQLVVKDEPSPGSPVKSVTKRRDPAGPEAFQGHLQAFLQYWKANKNADIQTYIHPNIGFYYITRPGAMDAVYHGKNFEEVFKEAYTPWVPGLLKQISCKPKFEEIPEFDCDGFSKEGCFVASLSSYSRASELMKALTQSEVGKFSKEMDLGVEKAEGMVSYQVIVTDQALSMSWGTIQGKWYLLFLDVATYDCSA